MPRNRTSATRYRRALWLLVGRDLRVRYSTAAIGYVWTVLEPLLLAAIYWLVFTQLFERVGGEDPYIVFLLSALLPWLWFNSTVAESTTAFRKESKLVRSTTIPRSIWILRIVVARGIEFLLSLPVLVFFAIISGATLHWQVVYFVPAFVLQFGLTVGLGLLVGPLVVLYRDLERVVKLILRLLFYGSAVLYSLERIPGEWADIVAINPLIGIFELYRAGFFPQQLDWLHVAFSAGFTALFLTIGILVFQRLKRTIMKEL